MTSSGADFYKDVTLNGSSSGTAKINIGNNFYLSHVNSTGITTFNHSGTSSCIFNLSST